MKASDIMGRPVVAAAKTTTARDVAIQMLMGGFGGMPITERDRTILGIVSEFDIIHAIREGKSGRDDDGGGHHDHRRGECGR